MQCISFLENRASEVQKELEEIIKTIPSDQIRDEKIQRVAKLRRMIANDLSAADTLRKLAREIERVCSTWITVEIASEYQSSVVAIYVLFYKLRIPISLSNEVMDMIGEALAAVLPKPEVKTVVSAPKPAAAKKAVEKPKEQKKKNFSGVPRKWNVIKQPEVKTVDELRKEIQATRISFVF